MGRRRKLELGDPELTIRELVIRHDIDPVDHMLKLVKETLPYPDQEFIAENPGFLKQLIDDGYAPFVDESGKKRLRLNKRMQVDIMKAIAPYIYATQKAVEIQSKHEYEINVTVKSFEVPSGVVVDALRQAVPQIQIPEAIPVEQIEKT